jgi:hypothetical protein
MNMYRFEIARLFPLEAEGLCGPNAKRADGRLLPQGHLLGTQWMLQLNLAAILCMHAGRHSFVLL